MQTLCMLHNTVQLAHMDISIANVMLSHQSSVPWDTVRLLDFGFSAPCTSGIALSTFGNQSHSSTISLLFMQQLQ